MARSNLSNREIRQARRNKRVERLETQEVRKFKEKFADERESMIVDIQPKTDNQAAFLRVLKHNQISIGQGSAGAGKSYIAATHAVNCYLKDPSLTIYLARAYVPMGRSVGLLPGEIESKLTPFLAPLINPMRKQLGPKFDADFGTRIQIQMTEALRGLDLKDAILVCDEAQNLTRDEIKSIVTRLNESNSQIILIGDSKQSDLKKGESGLEWLIEMVKKYDVKGVDFVEFGPEDIVRGGIVKQFVKIFDAEGV